jgi:hypothetical protein
VMPYENLNVVVNNTPSGSATQFTIHPPIAYNTEFAQRMRDRAKSE